MEDTQRSASGPGTESQGPRLPGSDTGARDVAGSNLPQQRQPGASGGSGAGGAAAAVRASRLEVGARLPRDPRKRVAIIGGGVSGLFIAYLLKDRDWEVKVFEKEASVGGNCNTATMNVGGYARWADLGVNDINEPMYEEVYELMQLLGVETPLLEDTASFFTRDNNTVYTIDGGFSTPMPVGFMRQYQRFQKMAGKVLHDPTFDGWTLRQFLQNPDFNFTDEFIHQCIFARANAMYFADDDDVGEMPIQAVLHYYVLQEGFGTNKPVRRRYIRGGTRAWAQKLLVASGARLVSGVDARVKHADESGVVITGNRANGERLGEERFDAVVVACHANQALRVLDDVADNEVKTMLGRVRYAGSTAYAHVDPSVLPERRSAWRTYNVLIRDKSTPKDYSMTYVINHHQADAENTHDDYFHCPQYFVSLNPYLELQSDKILRDPDGKEIQASFPHNVMDFNCLRAQKTLWDPERNIQGRRGIYFSGGWTVGAGLHIECWNSAKQVVKLLSAPQGEEARDLQQLTYNPSRGREGFAPTYIRHLLG